MIPSPMHTVSRIHQRIDELETRVCLGIDPRPTAHPRTHSHNFRDHASMMASVVAYFQEIIAATHPFVACYKLQSAFFECLGIEGLQALRTLSADIRSRGVPCILDAKRGDIGSTAHAYAEAYLADGVFRADALTVNPYLGADSLEPFVDVAQQHARAIFVLVKTSNPGSHDIQLQTLADGGKVYDRVIAMLNTLGKASQDAQGYSAIGAVVGATDSLHLRHLRQRLPHSLLLVPGYGAQGGAAEDVWGAFDAAGRGAVISSSRALSYGHQESMGALGAWAAEQARGMRDAINRVCL